MLGWIYYGVCVGRRSRCVWGREAEGVGGVVWLRRRSAERFLAALEMGVRGAFLQDLVRVLRLEVEAVCMGTRG